MAYIVPKVLIDQEFTQLPVYREFPLAAFIIGPQYSLSRYTVADEKPFTAVTNPSDAALGNAYQPLDTVTYEIPNVPAGGHSDPNYTKVYLENAVASYFPNAELGATPNSDDDYVDYVTAPSGGVYKNRVRFYGNETGALTSQYGYARSPFFAGRDVRVGDLLTLTDSNGVTLNTSIKALIRDSYREDWSLSANVGFDSVVLGGNNGITWNTTPVLVDPYGNFTEELTGQFVTLQTNDNGPIDGVSYKIVAVQDANTLLLDREVAISTEGINYYIGGVYQDPENSAPRSYDLSGISYSWSGIGTDPLQNGFAPFHVTQGYVGHRNKRILSDTFTVRLTSGNSPFNARFSVVSQNGAFSPKTNVGLINNTLVVDVDDAGNQVALNFSGTTSFVVGKTLTFSVSAEVRTAVLNASGWGEGAYTGHKDITYKVTVVRGGPYYNGFNAAVAAKVAVTSTSVDSSAPVLVGYDTPFAVGNYGVTASFQTIGGSVNGGLVQGDSYYIQAKAARLGAVNVIELNHNIPATTIANEAELFINLSLKQNSVEVQKLRSLQDGTLNWTQAENYVTINSGVTVRDAHITANGNAVELPVSSGNIFVTHRDLLHDHVVSIGSASSQAEVARLLGTVHPDNPLAQGVNDAVLNSNGVVVYFLGVQSDDLEGYTKAIEIAQKSNKVYGFVPLTFDDAIQQAVVGHVNAYSTPNVGLWRVAWISIEDKATSTLYSTQADGTPWLATVTQDLEAPIAKLSLLTVEGATFLTDGVRPTDSVHLNFRTNADGSTSYDTYIVDEVRTETTLTLTASLPQSITTAAQVQIVRNFTLDERAANVAAIGGSYMNRRVRVVFPDVYKYDGVTKQGYFMAAALAGLRSGVVPHQGLTNTQILGADDLSKVVNVYNQEQLNTMAAAGVWLVAQSTVGAVPYVRHQLTSDATNLNTSEDSITTNVDSISYALMNVLSPYIGTYNVNPVNLQVIRDAIISELNFRATQTYTVRAGNQLVSFTPATDILLLQQDPTYKDRIDVQVRLNVPYPLNYINLTLVV